MFLTTRVLLNFKWSQVDNQEQSSYMFVHVCVCLYIFRSQGILRRHSIDVIHLIFPLEIERMCVFMLGVGLVAVHVSANAC